MSAVPLRRTKFTPEQYLVFERSSDTRHEYFDGEIYDMVGASRNHNLIVQNLGLIVNTQIQSRSCESYANDMRVMVNPARLYAYPDFIIVCGTPRFDREDPDMLLNPTIIVEVLSHSTEAYDRGVKADQYRALPSLQGYLLVAQDTLHVTRFARQADNTWRLTDHTNPDDGLTLDSVQCMLRVADIYHKVTFST